MINNNSITVWVVRHSAFSIQCGGLERVFVHFTKPTYVFTKPLTSKQRETPFGDILESEGLYDRFGWIETEKKTWVERVSVGNWIGYNNEISEYIWEKLKEHFHNEPLENWDTIEKDGRSKIEDFCLELNISLSLNLPQLSDIKTKNSSPSSEFEQEDKCPSCGSPCDIHIDLDERDECNECR